MKIGMILDNGYPPDPRVENEALELLKEGHEVYLFCLGYGTFVAEEVHKGIQVRRYASNVLEYKLSALAYTLPLYTWLLARKIRVFVKETGVSALHIHDMRVAEAAFLANKRTALPTVLDLHENRPEIMRFYPHLQKWYGKLLISINRWKRKEEEFVRLATNTIVVTEEAKEELVSRTGVPAERVKVVPNTVRRAFFEDEQQVEIAHVKGTDEFTVLYLGDTGKRRGLLTVVEALARIQRTHPDIHLVIVGKTSAYLEKRIAELKLSNSISLMGWQLDTCFPSYIKMADVCISPLHRNIHHDTTYANKVFQYMSMGKPVLVSDAIAQERIVKMAGGGLIHRAEDVGDFTDKLLTLYREKSLRKELGSSGKSFVKEQFTWDKTSEELKNIYRELA